MKQKIEMDYFKELINTKLVPLIEKVSGNSDRIDIVDSKYKL